MGGTDRRARSRREQALLVVAGVLVGAVAIVVPSTRSGARTTQTLAASEVKALIASAPRVDLVDVTIVGDLDLTDLGTIKVPLRCTRCRIDGDVIAPDVTFARQVDLDGVTITGGADLRGAIFEGPLLARSEVLLGPDDAEEDLGAIGGDADFSFAAFRDSAAFDGISFHGVADFTGARFGSDASFIGSSFASDARFDQANFDAFASFNGLRRGPRGDKPGTFDGPATFRNARFAAVVDMTVGQYHDVLDLRGATFGDGLGLLNSTIGKGLLAQGVAFTTLDARGLKVHTGDVALQQAKGRTLQLDETTLDQGNIRLDSAAVTDSVSLELVHLNATCPKVGSGEPLAGCILLDGLVTGQLQMDLNLVPRIYGPPSERRALEQIEATERKDGNSDKANSAAYLLLRSQGDQKSGLAWFFDYFFYRGAAGYLVRPLHPLVALLLVIFIGWMVRMIYRDNRTRHLGAELKGARRATVRLGARVAKWLDALTAALSAAFRPKPNIHVPDEDHEKPIAYVIAGLLLLEYVATKVLILVFFLCLANYNETLRELIQGVLP